MDFKNIQYLIRRNCLIKMLLLFIKRNACKKTAYELFDIDHFY